MRSLTVWAVPGLPPKTLDDAILWEAFLPDDKPPGWISLPDYVHRERERLRSRYQSWLISVSSSDVKGVTLASFMSIRTNLSYWWMTLPTDNALAVDSPAYRIVRLFALSDVTAEIDFDHITVVTDQPHLAETVALWARSAGKSVTIDTNDASGNRKEYAPGTRAPMLAMLRVFWNHLRIALQASRKAGRGATGQGVMLVDYLAHLRTPRQDGAFQSNYWGPLVGMLEPWPEPVNWFHIPAKYATPAIIRSDVDRCAAFNTAHSRHSLLHSYLDLRTLGRALRDYARIQRFGWHLRRNRNVFLERETGLDPSPLLNDLLQDQFTGRTAALNACWINVWESAINALPQQRLGIFLFENQPWELAFLAAWRRSHFGRLLAVSHSTMTFWDLRYFPGEFADDPRSRPTPNAIVVNGPLMKAAALQGGYSEHLLPIAETLRSQPEEASQDAAFSDVLVLGEYDVAHDKEIIEIARNFADASRPAARVTYRPHPTAKIDASSLPAEWSLSRHPTINAAVATSRISICGPTTSAALDARLMGKSIVVIGLANTFISCPALGLPNVYVAKTTGEAMSLAKEVLSEPVIALDPGFVCRDSQLTHWHRLISDGYAG